MKNLSHENPNSNRTLHESCPRHLYVMETVTGARYLLIETSKNYACLLSFAKAYGLDCSNLFKWLIGKVETPFVLDVQTEEFGRSMQFFDQDKFWTFFPNGIIPNKPIECSVG